MSERYKPSLSQSPLLSDFRTFLRPFRTSLKGKHNIAKVWNPAKLAFRGEFIAIKANIRKEERSPNATVNFFLKKLGGGVWESTLNLK